MPKAMLLSLDSDTVKYTSVCVFHFLARYSHGNMLWCLSVTGVRILTSQWPCLASVCLQMLKPKRCFPHRNHAVDVTSNQSSEQQSGSLLINILHKHNN